MKVTFETQFNIDICKERDRIRKLWARDVLTKNRLLLIINTVASGNFDEAYKFYLKLPRDPKLECPQQEFMPLWFEELMGAWFRSQLRDENGDKHKFDKSNNGFFKIFSHVVTTHENDFENVRRSPRK